MPLNYHNSFANTQKLYHICIQEEENFGVAMAPAVLNYDPPLKWLQLHKTK
jgi:hypothetical protein